MRNFLLATAAMVSITFSAIAEQAGFGCITQLNIMKSNVEIKPITFADGIDGGWYTTGDFKLGSCSVSINYNSNASSCKYHGFVKSNSINGYGHTLQCHKDLTSTITELENACGVTKPGSYISQFAISGHKFDMNWSSSDRYRGHGESILISQITGMGKCGSRDISYNSNSCKNGYSAISMLGMWQYKNSDGVNTDCQEDFNELIRGMIALCKG